MLFQVGISPLKLLLIKIWLLIFQIYTQIKTQVTQTQHTKFFLLLLCALTDFCITKYNLQYTALFIIFWCLAFLSNFQVGFCKTS